MELCNGKVLPGDRPVLKVEFRHRETSDVGGGQRCSNSDRGRGDQAVCLVEGDSPFCVVAPPTARTLSLGGTQRRQAQSPNEPPCGGFLLGVEASPDLFDGDRADPRFHVGAAKTLSGLSAMAINSRRRYSCRERPLRAARLASSSLVRFGTFLMVMEVGIACIVQLILLLYMHISLRWSWPKRWSTPNARKRAGNLVENG